MATTIITGRDLTLTIDSKNYDAQASSVILNLATNRQEYDVLDGKVYKTLNNTGTLDVEMFADWGAVGSLCEALWSAANTAPDTGLAFTFTANTGAVFAGSVLPAFPNAGGGAADAVTATVSLTIVNGAVTLT